MGGPASGWSGRSVTPFHIEMVRYCPRLRAMHSKATFDLDISSAGLSLSRIGHARVRRSVTDESSWTVEGKMFVANVVHQRGLSVSIIFSELEGKHAQDPQMRVTWHI